MSRLPTVGGDDNTWGNILNDFLSNAHNADGSLQSSAVTAAGAEMAANKGQPSGYAPLDNTGKVPSSNLPTTTTPDATTSSKGIIQLAGDLAGTAALPTVPGLANKVGSVTATDSTITIGGTSTAPTIGVNSIPESKVTNLANDLAGKLNASALDTDGTMAADSDAHIPSQKAVVTYVGAHGGMSTPVTADVIANRPAAGAGNKGNLYFATDDSTDSTSGTLYLSTGSTWLLLPRTMHGLVNFFVVEDYGAVGDGVTDDSGAFNTVISLLDPNRAGTIVCRNKKYYWASGVSITVDGTTIIGAAQPGISSSHAKGCTQIIVNDGITGLTIGTTSLAVRGFRLENLNFYEKTAGGSSSTILVKQLLVQNSDYVNCGFGDCTLGKIFVIDGTGGNAGYANFTRCRFGASPVAFQQTAANATTFNTCLFMGYSSTITSGSIGIYQISGDTLKVVGGTRLQGYDTLIKFTANVEHTIDDSTRYEVWQTAAVEVGSSVSRSYIGGSGDNSLNGSVGSGVVIDSGAADISVNTDIQSISGTSARIVDNGTRTRYGIRTDMLYHPKGIGTITKGSAFADSDFVSPKDGLIGIRTDQVGIDIRSGGLWHSLTGGGGGSLTSNTNYLSSDVTMTNSNTDYDGPSLSLAAGTWLLIGAADLKGSNTGIRTWTAKIWDGTTVITTGYHTAEGTAASARQTVPLAAVVSPGATTTYKISCQSTVAADVIQSDLSHGSYLLAVKIA